MTKKQIGKRFLQILIVLFGISFLTFGLTYLSPGDPAEIMLTECGNLPTPELLEQTRHELGLDQPFLVQYGSWLKGVLTGDLGQSYSFKMPVVQKLVSCFWPTLKMSLLALLMMIVISIPLGILAAVYQNKFPDYFVRGITFIGVSVPSFWLGLILLSIFGVQLRWVNSRRKHRLKGDDPAVTYVGPCHVCEIYKTGKKCGSGGASPGLCNRCTNERNQRERNPLETCSSECNAPTGNSAWTFSGKSSWRYCGR